MKRILVLLSSIIVAIASCSNVEYEESESGNQTPGVTETPEYDIYLVIDQSNAAGRGINAELAPGGGFVARIVKAR